MRSPTGIIPEALMYPARLGEVLRFLKALPVPGHEKRDLLIGWAKTVGVKLRASLLASVERSGVDL